MNCEEINKHIQDYIDNNLSGSLKAELEQHLSVCDKCKEEIEQFTHIYNEIDNAEITIPNHTLSDSFDAMLENEKKRMQMEVSKTSKTDIIIALKPYLRVAAAIVLFISGYLFAVTMHKPNTEESMLANKQILELNTEINQMKQLVMLSMLEKNSPSERIKAVSYTSEIDKPNTDIINALLKTLIEDNNTNVRIAALGALEPYYQQDYVRPVLVKALEKETNPALQIELINVLVKIQETPAIAPMQNIIENPKTIELVKTHAGTAMEMLVGNSERQSL